MPAPEAVNRLVATFDQHIEHYKSARYNETQLRREFLDPFFRALGWDIDNEAGYADAYKDVIHEDAIRIGSATKAPDYCFRIGGARKFFVEAKRPNVDIHGSPHPAYQTRRYAWSAKLPLAILSDFEEFAVYDTRVRPSLTDKSSAARVFYCKYEEYNARWDEIANIFARDSILRGSFDKFAESNKKKRGTAEVDDAFLAEIESWRELLAKSIASRNDDLSVRALNFAVQLTIDRIVFLRICEDRGTEDYGRLKGTTANQDIYAQLCALFQDADRRYNSGLFHFSREKDQCSEPDSITRSLRIDDKPLKQILSNLYYPECPYEFSVLPADILGQVYERFLGKTISLGPTHRVVIDDKPEVRKAGGVYYTPTYVVNYIVGRTLGPLLNGSDAQEAKPIPVSQASKLRVLDPACGSGSFLLVAYQYLLDWHLARYVENSDYHARGTSPRIYQTRGGEYRLTTTERKRILLNNVFGVDIDPQAVEVTKLSLLLKVLEGETEQVLQRDWIKERQRILPDLGKNIQCGNSLVDSRFYQQTQMLLLDDDAKFRANVFDWEVAFPDVQDDGGFDCVISNPPYGATLDLNQRAFFKDAYTCQSYQLDSYLLFLERTLRSLLRDNGRCGFIIPNPWLTNVLQHATRRFVCSAASIETIVHFTYPVFKAAVVDTEIVIARREVNPNHLVEVRLGTGIQADGSLESTTTTTHPQSEWIALDGEVINIFLKPDERKLFKQISAHTAPLSNWFDINVGIKPYQIGKGSPKQSDEIVKTRPFDSDHQVDSTYQPLLRGADINRFVVAPAEASYISYGPWLAESRPAAKFNASEKLLVRQTADKPIAALDTEQRLAMNNLHVLVPLQGDTRYDIRYFLALLNSKLLTWCYRCRNPEAGEALAEVKRHNVAALPVRSIDFSNPIEVDIHHKLVQLASLLEHLRLSHGPKTDPQSSKSLATQIEAAEDKLDELVFSLYGLTSDDVRLVTAGTFNKS